MHEQLAIFDLDNTLLIGDSDHAWGEFLIEEGLVDHDSHKRQNDSFYQDYLDGQLDIWAYQAFALSTIAGKTPSELAPLHDKFMANKIEAMIGPKALALLEEHRQKNHQLLIITATNDFITAPIAKRLGIDELLGCTAEINNGKYTGKIIGTPCFQQGKVDRLKEWLEKNPHSPDTAYFYSDSHNDLPLLKTVGNPVAVDPDDKLLAHARQHCWPVISLR